MKFSSLESIARALVAPGKGILAADESLPTIEKRFRTLPIPSTEESRRAYRDLLFTAPGLGKYISGAILFDETMRQKTSDGTPMCVALGQRGIIPGIKVDEGAKSLANFPGEKVTSGLDGLRGRLAEYRGLGARFTKWRAVIAIGPQRPSAVCLRSNAECLARFAALSQEAGLAPIVEPEVLMDGPHTLARCEEVTRSVLEMVFEALLDHRVSLEGMLLKTGMVLSGAECPRQADLSEVAEATLRCLRRAVPAAVPGVVFLSGGQSDKAATKRLNAICRLPGAPWNVSFSFGRALQAPALTAWKGQARRVVAAQRALVHRARCNGAAVQGRYSPGMEKAARSNPIPRQRL